MTRKQQPEPLQPPRDFCLCTTGRNAGAQAAIVFCCEKIQRGLIFVGTVRNCFELWSDCTEPINVVRSAKTNADLVERHGVPCGRVVAPD